LLHPDESVVRGLALRCADAGAQPHAANVSPLPIGVAIGGGWIDEVTPSGSMLPVARLVSPTADGTLRFFRGDSARCDDNAPFGAELHVEHADQVVVLVQPSGVQLGSDSLQQLHSEL
jgi:molecular chaperone DnaK (HSP70)